MKLGVDLGGSHIGVGLVEGINLIDTVDKFFSTEDRNNMEEAVFNNTNELISQILEKNNMRIGDIEEIGVAAPGTISNGKITAWNLGLKEYNFQKYLEEKYNLKVRIRNDGKCAALAEKIYGTLKDVDDALFINIGTGLGGAAFFGGKLLEPKKSSGFEFGHITLVKDGKECTCGKKGCFEQYCSIKALKRNILKTLNITSTDISGQYLREVLMVEHKDEVQKDIDEFIDYLRIGVCDLIDIFEPEVVCFGGSFSYYEGHPVLKKLIEEINKEGTTFNSWKPRIVTATFKNDAGMIGATLD